MALFQRYKWAAALVSVSLTAIPLFWLTSWLQTQGEAEVAIAARWSMGITDLAVGETVNRLNDLAAKNLDPCQPPQIQMMRQAVFASGLIRELSVVDPNGQTLCTDTGSSFAARDLVASAATVDPTIMLDVVKIIDSDERMLRVRRLAPDRASMLAALLRPSQLLPQVMADGDLFTGYARLTFTDGSLIGIAGNEAAVYGDHLLKRAQSSYYGIVVTIVMQRGDIIANYDDLRRIGMVVSGLVAMVLLGFALVIPWYYRQRISTPEIERALAAGEFIPYYQPVIDIVSGKINGAEVLVRWKKSDGTIVTPGAFIPLVESSGLVLDLTRSLMRQVCVELGPTLHERPDMSIGFNIAPRHLKDAMLLNDVGAIFEGSPIRLSQVVLELTERYELENLGAARRVIAALQALGCRIALDDVGTGHSGLSYILKLGVDIIKIDRIFVEAIRTDPQTQTIVKSLVDLASNMQMRIVAEGVEQFEQMIYLRDMGITAAQGYCFAPPLPAALFVQLVQAADKRATPDGQEALPDPFKTYGTAAGRSKVA